MNDKILFSIIVPVYNVEKYIDKCIESIINQTINCYELIIINDGSTDNSEIVLEKYKNLKNVKIIKQKNEGLSSARNVGINLTKGKYLLFVDSDDYIEKDLLETLKNNIVDQDIIRFQCQTVDEDYNIINKYNINENNNDIESIIKLNFVEPSCLYAYKRSFIKNNNLLFKKGMFHEDFGFTLKVFNLTNNILILNYIGYNYLIRNNSIINSKDYSKTLKKCNDFFEQGLENINIIKNSQSNKSKYLLSYIANSMILKGRELNKKDRKLYLKKLKNNNISKYMLTDTFTRKLKKVLFNFNYNIYLKVI